MLADTSASLLLKMALTKILTALVVCWQAPLRHQEVGQGTFRGWVSSVLRR